ncbi:adhesion G-protein coupled receptor G7-like [Physella acuta]|uniref:adhesion G-protein coupled receptor G7-like n=1 Tax=Physella acuta TaxID=109671 RepID=UPI0027DD7F8F|nr:adhesion G-protein coupled receptor G7-like [Physella acuta]
MSLILPSVAVSMVVTFSYVYTQERVIGYGHLLCYLDSPLLNGVTFVCPLTLITISNVVFFGTTVYKIHSTINLQSAETVRKDNQHHIYVYVKLSFMTGAFWTLAIVAETVDNQVLRLISIILNGLQGVAIFVSYICNKRVFNLYWNPKGHNSTMVSEVERN